MVEFDKDWSVFRLNLKLSRVKISRKKEALENSTEQKRIICGSGRVWCVERQEGIEAMLEANSTPIWLDSGLRILLKSAILETLFSSPPPPQSFLNQYFGNSFEWFVRGGGRQTTIKKSWKYNFLHIALFLHIYSAVLSASSVTKNFFSSF